jgi:hypothetical protein
MRRSHWDTRRRRTTEPFDGCRSQAFQRRMPEEVGPTPRRGPQGHAGGRDFTGGVQQR